METEEQPMEQPEAEQFTQEEIDAAAAVENGHWLNEQVNVLKRRVIALQVQVQRLQAENQNLRDSLPRLPTPQDRRAKKKSQKKG